VQSPRVTPAEQKAEDVGLGLALLKCRPLKTEAYRHCCCWCCGPLQEVLQTPFPLPVYYQDKGKLQKFPDL